MNFPAVHDADGSFCFKSFFIIQHLQNFDMASTFKTSPLSREMAANTPLLLEKPLRSHVIHHTKHWYLLHSSRVICVCCIVV